MEYVQERIATLHDFTDPVPDAPTDEAAVVVPMTEREHASLAAERVFTALEAVDPGRVVVALRADAEQAPGVADWLAEFDLALDVLWCDAPGVATLLADHGLDGARGKGRDVWLALGVAADAAEYVVVHDADTKTYSERHVARLLFPLAHDFSFAKGYYARVENGRLYGRLFRLFYAPLVRALADAHDAPVLDYLAAFRYALAGEFAATSAVARSLRVQRGWGLEVGTLGDAFDAAGVDGTAQVDLGRHEHDHRAVSGPAGLSTMSEEVGAALLHVVEEGGVVPDYGTLPERYREAAGSLIDGYALDAAFNGLAYDRGDERAQVDAYAEAIRPPETDTRLPAWADAPITPGAVLDAAADALRTL
ncbi:glycosyl transferase family 2 [Halorarius litoreus]|uniref:glycosyl transferase family 2 n=1 Tax=Halorarius litoreus TaxID=2962676 RepID=UPI0020CBE5C1|nr:glycosyl transferase family 2 [Halorarius litoreus]